MRRFLSFGRRIRDSRHQEHLPLASSASVRADYIDHVGSIKISRVLEDLDAFAGYIAYLHCGIKLFNQEKGRPVIDALRSRETRKVSLDRPMIVTASLDRLDLHNNPTAQLDAKYSGQVTYVGSSSMEVSVKLEELMGKNIYLEAKFTMVARDPIKKTALKVPKLQPETEEEKRLFDLGEQLKAKKITSAASLSKTLPTPDERLIIHDLWLKSLENQKAKWMSDTVVQSLHTMYPQDRNIHNFIFGGYLMRLACELAQSCSTLYAQTNTRFLAMDDIWFKKPVPIGSLLSLRASVIYSKNNSFLIKVTADVVDPETYKEDNTNVFHFIFATVDNKTLPELLPKTYSESMMYLEGKRRWDKGNQIAHQIQSSLLSLW